MAAHRGAKHGELGARGDTVLLAQGLSLPLFSHHGGAHGELEGARGDPIIPQ